MLPLTLVASTGNTGSSSRMPPACTSCSSVAAVSTFVIDAKPNTPPGTYSIVLSATAQIQYEGGKGKRPTTIEQAVTPIVVNVIPLAIANVSATPAGNLKGGMATDVTVKVVRQNDYVGDFKVKLVLPMGTKGVTVDEATIPAGQTEVKLKLSAAADVDIQILLRHA